MSVFESNLLMLTRAGIGERAADTLAVLDVDVMLAGEEGERVSRAVFAMALNAVLFRGLLDRAHTGAAYVADVRRKGGKVCFDHGALRTMRFGAGATGALPAGAQAFARILSPLGYTQAGIYPLDRLKMTGYAYAHRDFPEAVPQFFVSELHVDRFTPVFQGAAQRVFGASRDPLNKEAEAALSQFSLSGHCDKELALVALPQLAAAFDRWHDAPTLADYEMLLAESAEAAWIATEGNAFNHATDRVPDVDALAEGQRALGRPIKDKVEVSSAGSVRQTAFKADYVERGFKDGEVRQVPGSFYEFITRDRLDDDVLDLRFDSSNAQGIFKMTAAG